MARYNLFSSMWITDCRQIAFCYLVPILQLYELMLLQATTLLENEYIKLSFVSSDNIYMMVTTSITNCITSSWSLLLITQYYKYSLGIYLWVIYCCPLRLCCGRYMCCLISSLVYCKHLTTCTCLNWQSVYSNSICLRGS